MNKQMKSFTVLIKVSQFSFSPTNMQIENKMHKENLIFWRAHNLDEDHMIRSSEDIAIDVRHKFLSSNIKLYNLLFYTILASKEIINKYMERNKMHCQRRFIIILST